MSEPLTIEGLRKLRGEYCDCPEKKNFLSHIFHEETCGYYEKVEEMEEAHV